MVGRLIGGDSMDFNRAIGQINRDIVVGAARNTALINQLRASGMAASPSAASALQRTQLQAPIPHATVAQLKAGAIDPTTGQPFINPATGQPYVSTTSAMSAINPSTGQPYPPGVVNPQTGMPYTAAPGTINPMTGLPYYPGQYPGSINPMTGQPYYPGQYPGSSYAPGYFPPPSEASYGAAYDAPTAADFGLSAGPSYDPYGGSGGGGFGGIPDSDFSAYESYQDPMSQIGYWNT
jgi:hypothetical protein